MNEQNPQKAFLQKMERAIGCAESWCAFGAFPWEMLETVFSGKLLCADGRRNSLFSSVRKALSYSEEGLRVYEASYPLLKTSADEYCRYLKAGLASGLFLPTPTACSEGSPGGSLCLAVAVTVLAVCE